MKPELTKNALRVLEKRILARDQQGRLTETPEEMLLRVSRCVAQADLQYSTHDDAVTSELHA